jgi:hypothetical protein
LENSANVESWPIPDIRALTQYEKQVTLGIELTTVLDAAYDAFAG